MIVRLVTMTFQEDQIDSFLDLFNASKHKIRGTQGCLHLQLIQNSKKPNQISTLSHWESEIHLNQYRNSELFGLVWPKTKIKFSEKAQATTFHIL